MEAKTSRVREDFETPIRISAKTLTTFAANLDQDDGIIIFSRIPDENGDSLLAGNLSSQEEEGNGAWHEPDGDIVYSP